MVRVKRGNRALKRRKKVLKMAKGFRAAHSRLFRIANQQVMKALKYAYVGRKQRKRNFRRLWNTRINAMARQYGVNYSQLIHGLKKYKIAINRKMLAQLAVLDEEAFSNIISLIKT